MTRLLAGVAAVAAVLVVVAIVLLTRDPTPSPSAEATPPAGATPSAAASPSAEATSASPTPTPSRSPSTTPPAFAVAASVHGRVVVLDTTNGATVRTLYELEGDGQVLDVSLAPDGETVLFSVLRPQCAGELYRVPIEGGRPERLADGFTGAIAPDGTRLAYAAGECANTLVVRELSSGDERVWHPAQNGFDEVAAITRIDWAPDSRRLAFDQQYEGSSVSVLDTGVEGDLDAATPLRLQGLNLASPVWTDEGIAVATSCCYERPDPAASRVVVVDEQGREIDELAASIPSIGTRIDLDDSGSFLLITSGSPGSPSLVMVDEDRASTPMGEGFVDAAW